MLSSPASTAREYTHRSEGRIRVMMKPVSEWKGLIGPSAVLFLPLFALLLIFAIQHGSFASIENQDPSLPLSSDEEAGVSLVVKKTFSDRMRLFFMVGLEGTGHHHLYVVLNKMFAKHEELTRIEKCNLTTPYDLAKYEKGNSKYVEDIQKARHEMRRVAILEKTLPPAGGILTLQGCEENEVGMQSFPNFDGQDKALQYPDVRMLAEVAEAEGVDLRVVYLKRSAEGILGSTARRGYHRKASPTNARRNCVQSPTMILGTHLFGTHTKIIWEDAREGVKERTERYTLLRRWIIVTIFSLQLPSQEALTGHSVVLPLTLVDGRSFSLYNGGVPTSSDPDLRDAIYLDLEGLMAISEAYPRHRWGTALVPFPCSSAAVLSNPTLSSSLASYQSHSCVIQLLKRDHRNRARVLITAAMPGHSVTMPGRTGDWGPQNEGDQYKRYVIILLTDLGVAHSMLSELDPRFITCFDFSLLGDTTQASNLANFTAPTPQMALTFADFLVKTAAVSHKPENEGLIDADAERALLARLQRKLDNVEATFCK